MADEPLSASNLIASAACEGVGVPEVDVRKVLSGPDRGLFQKAIAKEKEGLLKHDIYDDKLITDVPAGTKIFRSYMVCLKKALGGVLWKAKARWVVDGRGSVPGLHTEGENYGSHLPPWFTVRTLLSLGVEMVGL